MLFTLSLREVPQSGATKQSSRFDRLKALSEAAGLDRDECLASAATALSAHLAMTQGKS